MNVSRLRSSLQIVMLYALVGGIWIVASDRILGILVPDMGLYVLFSTYKGWFYVVITSLMLFGLMRVEDHRNRKLEERYRLLFEISPDPLFVADLEGRILEVNQRFSELYGFSRAELLRMQVTDLEAEAGSISTQREGLRWEVSQHFERRHRKKDESIMDVDIRCDPIEWQDRTSSLGSIRDITERKKAEAVLRDSESKFRALVEGNIIGVIVTHRDGQILQANEAFFAMTGYQQADMPLDWHMMTPPEWMELDTKAIQALNLTGSAQPWEKEYIRKDGRRLPVMIGVTVLDPSGGLIAFILDLSERKATEASIRASLAEKEILLREVHHRVKNNLQIIIALADLQGDQLSDPLQRKCMEELRQRVYAIALVHESLVSFETLSSISASDYIEQVAGNLYTAIGREPIQLTVRADEMRISLDKAVPFGLILNELLTNAFKHAFAINSAGQDCRVWVDLRHDGSMAILEVGDNGAGLPEPCADETQLGLGLRLVERLAHQLDARLEVLGGQGTRFRIYFANPEVEKSASVED